VITAEHHPRFQGREIQRRYCWTNCFADLYDSNAYLAPPNKDERDIQFSGARLPKVRGMFIFCPR